MARFVRFFVCTVLCAFVLLATSNILAESSKFVVDGPDELARIIDEMQEEKARNISRSAKIAGVIWEAGERWGVSPKIAAALAYRESQFRRSVQVGAERGSRGELGFFQVMPRSVPVDLCGRGRNLLSMRDNAETALCFLNELRRICGTRDMWVLIGAYGLSRCPTPREARGMASVKLARSIYCGIESDCGRLWPN